MPMLTLIAFTAWLAFTFQQTPGELSPMAPGPDREIKLVKEFDRNGDGWLNRDERDAARQDLDARRGRMGGRGRGGPGGPGMGPGMGRGDGSGRGRQGMGRGGPGAGLPGRGGPGRGGERAAGTPGARVAPADIAAVRAPLYDPHVLRTVFLEFEREDWESELAAFYGTDVDIPATLIVDGTRYPDVGVHFRGASSFMMVPDGLKRSLNVSVDFRHANQHVNGHRTLNLLNSHDDPTFLRSVLFFDAARAYLAAPRANYVRVVINGESWGVYVNVEQFNKDFVRDRFGSADGARWKVPGRPNGRGGLEYLGDDPAPYRAIYEIKTRDDAASWNGLIELCRVLNTTPPDRLESTLAPILDIDGILEFLALDTALVNGDGYWVRASDYHLYRDPAGRFHLVPHDANETFSARGGGPGRMGGGGGGGRGGPGGPGMRGGATLDPLVGLDDPTRPLRSKLLAVPALREKYLGYVRDIATRWLDWAALGPRVDAYRSVIADAVRADTRKLDSDEAFDSGVAALKAFVEERRAFLLAFSDRTER